MSGLICHNPFSETKVSEFIRLTIFTKQLGTWLTITRGILKCSSQIHVALFWKENLAKYPYYTSNFISDDILWSSRKLVNPFIWLSRNSSNAFFRQMAKRIFFTCCMVINSQSIFGLLYTLSHLSTREMLQNWDLKIFLNKNLSWRFWVRSCYSKSDVCMTTHSANQWWWCYL